MNYSLSFSVEVGEMLCIVLQCIFGRDFLSPRTTIVSGIKNYPLCLVATYPTVLTSAGPLRAQQECNVSKVSEYQSVPLLGLH